MGHLKTLASRTVESSIDGLSPRELVEEACSVFVSRQDQPMRNIAQLLTLIFIRYPEWCRVYAERLSSALSSNPEAKRAFERKLSAYFSGMLPHCKEIMTSTFLYRLNDPTIHFAWDNCSAAPRVSQTWPNETKDALHTSLDSGIFDDFKLPVLFGIVHLPSAFMDGDTQSWLSPTFISCFSLLTWVVTLLVRRPQSHLD